MAEVILVIGPSWVGDMIMAQPLLALLKQRHPGCVIDVMAPDWSHPVLARIPEVRQALALPLKHGEFGFFKRREMGMGLRNQYTRAYVLPNSWKSALIPFFANIPVRTGWRGECRFGVLNDARRLNKKKYPRMVQRFYVLGVPKQSSVTDAIPAPSLTVNQTSIEDTLATLGVSLPKKPVLALCPGAAYGPAKRWPQEHFAEVANVYLQKGYLVWLFGSPEDKPVCAKVNALTKNHCHDFSGQLMLPQTMDLLSLSDIVVSNDSGLMHMAGALNKRVVGLYGSTSPSFAPPLGKHARALSLFLPCSPCKKRVCPLKHHDCMQKLLPHQIIDALEELTA